MLSPVTVAIDINREQKSRASAEKIWDYPTSTSHDTVANLPSNHHAYVSMSAGKTALIMWSPGAPQFYSCSSRLVNYFWAPCSISAKIGSLCWSIQVDLLVIALENTDASSRLIVFTFTALGRKPSICVQHIRS